MDSLLKEKADLMVENFYQLKKGFKWETSIVKHFGAMVHATKGKQIDIEALKEINKHIKSNTGLTSYFRGTNLFILSSLLSLEGDYKGFFKNILSVYEQMRSEGFKNSTYLPLAAYAIAKEIPMDQWSNRILRMNDLYKNMKKNHFWLTSPDDYVFAAVLATTDLDLLQMDSEIEKCYKLLNQEGFHKGNDLQSLSHILAIGEELNIDKCKRAMKLYLGLKSEKCKLQYNGLATLGVLTLINQDIDKIVNEVKQVYDYIKEQDGYGFWSLDTSMRSILAANLVADFYVAGIKKGVLEVALGNSINVIIIAQQQAMIAAACAASASAAASSGS
ncbi:MAG: DUF4003 domain-containing protein [Clostridiaceae bacterium]|nr:DUF4003 domain-containing protein [Clostridiaceae bacterium]